MTTTRLTKAQLLQRIAELEAEVGLRDKTLADLQREVDAYQVIERPSRRDRPAPAFERTVPVQRSLPAHFAAARELAMRTGRSVRVGA